MIRRHISSRERREIFTRHNETCGLCGGHIHPGEAWDVEHRIPLAMGGEDGGDNLYPAHAKCHREKTKVDVANLARAIRRQDRHTGAKAPSRNPLPFGRNSAFKKRMDGSVVRRSES